MSTLLDEARDTFRATVWMQRTWGRFMGVPMFWVRLAFVKEDGQPFTVTNWLILATYHLFIIFTWASIAAGRPFYIVGPLCVISGFMMGQVWRWVREK